MASFYPRTCVKKKVVYIFKKVSVYIQFISIYNNEVYGGMLLETTKTVDGYDDVICDPILDDSFWRFCCGYRELAV